MFLEAIVRLYDYQRESNDHLFEVTANVGASDLTNVIVDGQPSIRDTLIHMISTIRTHNAWWSGKLSGEDAFELTGIAENFPDLESIRMFWASVDQELKTFIDSLNLNSDLERTYSRIPPNGETRNRVLWEMMLHVINHGTQHRSEVAMMLTKIGHSPGDMEILLSITNFSCGITVESHSNNRKYMWKNQRNYQQKPISILNY